MSRTDAHFRQSGMALAQVLLLVAIISVLLVSMLHINQQMINTTDMVQQRTEVRLKLQTAKTRLIEALMTYQWVSKPDNAQANPYVKNWNFHGEEFSVDGVDITIQNDSSLIQLSIVDKRYLTRAFQTLNLDNPRQLAHRLVDWQDTDSDREEYGAEQGDYEQGVSVPNRRLQSMTDLTFIPGFTEQVIERIRRFSTLTPHASYSPTHAPNDLLPFFVEPDVVSTLKRMRDEGSYSERRFTSATGIYGDDMIYLAAGPTFRITLRTTQNNISQQESFTVELDPYGEDVLTYR